MEKVDIAVVSATLGLLGIMINRQNKISEFRHKSADDMRADISLALANTNCIQKIASDIAALESIISASKSLKEASNYRIKPQYDILDQKYEDEKFEANQNIIRANTALLEKYRDFQEKYITVNQSINSLKLSAYDNKAFLSELNSLEIELSKLYDATNNKHFHLINSTSYKNLNDLHEKILHSSHKIIDEKWSAALKGEELISLLKMAFPLLVIVCLPSLTIYFIADFSYITDFIYKIKECHIQPHN